MRKTIIVTGGSRGIGAAIVRLLANEGYNVVLNYNKSEEIAEKAKEEYTNKGYNVEIFRADVSKREEVKKLIEFAIDKFGTIDVIVNNAGIDNEKLFQNITDEDWNNVINTNLYSVFCMCQEAIPTMINKQSGSIINISSIYGTNGGSFAVAYSATKAGIIGLTKSLAKELGPSNIRVNAIAPGIIDTDMNKGYSKEDIDNIKEEIPLNRIGEGIDIAKCVKWIIEDEYTTGQVIKIDGGWYL
ncbi:MAG: 3-oxoacyl-ACP reductase FabG [Clostridia bacterium]|nr:3-oxoacyl-ACP reductase FabG [Clostridia bacterium]